MLYIKNISLTFILLFMLGALHAQRENKFIRRGNSDFEEKNYSEAEKNYFRSLSKGGNTYKGLFNLGDVYYEQKDYGQAGMLFDSVARLQVDEDIRSMAFYNLGNTLLSASIGNDTVATEALPLSIESYKEALRINPVDTAAKYNLAYAQMLLDDQQQQQDQDQNQDQDQDQNQDQEQDQQDQENQDQEDQQDKQDQQKQDQQQENSQQQQQQQQQPRQISKEDAERMLEAMKNDEKKTLEKVKLGKVKGKVVKSEKDW